MNSDSIAFLRIENIVQGKVEGYSIEDAIPLGIEAVNIGRPSKDSNTPSPDIKIAGDDYISRNQAEIRYSVEDDCFVLSDLGSRNEFTVVAEFRIIAETTACLQASLDQ